MTTTKTDQELLNDGWLPFDINDIKCWILDRGHYKLIAQDSKDGAMDANAYQRITKALGKPYKEHIWPSADSKEWITTTLEY